MHLSSKTSNEYTQTIHRGRSSLDLSPNSHNLLTRGESSKKILGVQGLLVLNPFNSQDLISNSPYCLTYNSCDVDLENLVLDQLIIA